jgi:outer membrane autotransporter protein
LEVDRTSADLLDVTGTACFDRGSNFAVTPLGVTLDGDTHTVVTATALTGNGVPDGDVSVTSPVLSFILNNDLVASPNEITMTTDRTPYQRLVSSSNQRDIAENLFSSLRHATGEWEQFLVLLDTLPTTAALENVLDDISPEVYANFSGMSRVSMNQYLGAIGDRLGDVRGTASLSDSAKEYTSNTLTSSGPVLADVQECYTTPWNVWVSGFGQWADEDGDSDEFGYEFDTTGIALGADVALNDNWTVGLSGGQSQTDVDYDVVDTDSDIDTWHLGVYAGWTNDLKYVDMALSYADNDYDTDRNITSLGLTADGDHDGEDLSLYLGGGMKTSADSVWTWIGSLQYIDHQEDSFTETGAGILNLDVDGLDSESLVAALGLRYDSMFECPLTGLHMEPEASAQVTYEFMDDQDSARARFTGSPVGSFSVDGVDEEELGFLLGAGLTAEITDAFSAFVKYDLELRDNFDAHMVSGGVKYNF